MSMRKHDYGVALYPPPEVGGFTATEDKKMWLGLLDILKNERDRRKSEDETVWEMPSVFYTALDCSS